MLNKENLNNRKNGIGASDMAGILGLSKWSTPVSVFLDKTRNKECFESEIMARGNNLEDFVLHAFSRETNLNLSSTKKTIYHPEKKFLLCHLDSIALLEDNLSSIEEDKIIEAKTQNISEISKWGEPGTDQVPEYIFIQCMYQLMVTGRNEVLIPVLFAKEEIFKSICITLNLNPHTANYFNVFLQYQHLFKFSIYKVQRNEELIKILYAKACDFWENNVMKNIPPEPKDIEEIKSLFPLPIKEKTVKAVKEDVDALILIEEKEKEIKKIQAEIDDLRFPLYKKIEDAEFLIDEEGRELVKYSLENYSSFNKIKLNAEFPEIYEKFNENKPRRVFRIIRKNLK